MSRITDRRLNGKGKSTPNRAKFLRRYRSNIKDTVRDAIKDSNIADINSGDTEVRIKRKDMNEPTFSHDGKTGTRTGISPGNKEFHAGDRVPKPDGGGEGKGGGGSNDPATEDDDFSFVISKEEFLDILFDDCALPNLVKTSLKDAKQYTIMRAGYSPVGNPTNLNIVKSFEKSIGRRLAMTGDLEDELEQLKELLAKCDDGQEKSDLLVQIGSLERQIDGTPFISEFDLRFNAHVKVPIPATSAAMFCLMDISGSMGEHEKDLAKRFYYLLYLFLERKYDKVDIIFIRHHTQAKEVDEEEFFYSTETGGTLVSSALALMNEIIIDRYSSARWNIYGAQCSDGDNWDGDNVNVLALLHDEIFPKVQYFAYIETAHEVGSMFSNGSDASDLWEVYAKIVDPVFAMNKVDEPKDIYPVFRELFKKD